MSRSVMTASDAVAIVYLHYDDDGGDEWDDLVDTLRYAIREQYTSFIDANRAYREHGFYANELRLILENDHAYVTISNYYGLVAVCLVPIDDDPDTAGLAEHWCQQVASNWSSLLNKAFNGLRKIGTASNGEAFFEKISN